MSEEQRSPPARTSWRHPGPAAPLWVFPDKLLTSLILAGVSPKALSQTGEPRRPVKEGLGQISGDCFLNMTFPPALIHKSCVAAVGSPVKSHVTPRARCGALCSSQGSAVTEPLVSHGGLRGGSWGSWSSSPPCSTSLKPRHRGGNPPTRLVRGNGCDSPQSSVA